MKQRKEKLDRPTTVTLLGAGIFLSAVVVLTGVGLLGSWRQNDRATGERLDSKVALMGQSTARTFQAVEATLAILDDEVVAASAAGPAAMQRALNEATDRVLRFTPHVRQILLTDKKGVLLFDSAKTGGSLPSLKDLGLERARLADTNVVGLVIGRAIPGRFLGPDIKTPTLPGLWVIPAARPLSDGSDRLLIAALSPGAILEGFMEALTVGGRDLDGDFAGLYGVEGDLLAALPLDRTNRPWNVPLSPSLAGLANTAAFGRQIMDVPFQNDQGWVSWWRDNRYPLVVYVGRTNGRILSDWRRSESVVLFGAVVFLAILTIATLIFVPMVIQRLRMQARIRVLEQAMDKGPAAVIVTDTQGRIEYVNESFTRLSGYASQEVLGQHTSMLRGDRTDPDVVADLWRTIKGGGCWRGELINRTRDGREWWVDMAISGVQDDLGAIIHYVAVQVDISDRKEAEVQTKNLLERLDQSNRDLEQFAYVASHDLQEPLRMVTSYLSLLRRRMKPVLTDDATTFLDFAEDGAKRMRQLIEDLLQYSRAGRGGLEPEPVNLEEVLEEAKAHLVVAIRDAGAEITVHGSLPMVMGNRLPLARLLMNVIGNAIKYQDPDRPPQIDVSARVEGADCILVVADNGLGIAEEEQERVFQPFQRGASAGRTVGTGIGLAICKKIAEKYGGSLSLDSELNKGSRFTVTLPLADSERR
ncbi:ATP-binding protein [Rhodospirillum sp. A1_3_36]|uniref:ATP-binding protein n=1 Tax=Rhodospirillum sp. A1_3_36 TaxID=3391666 RepID=UPI0039A77D21